MGVDDDEVDAIADNEGRVCAAFIGPLACAAGGARDPIAIDGTVCDDDDEILPDTFVDPVLCRVRKDAYARGHDLILCRDAPHRKQFLINGHRGDV